MREGSCQNNRQILSYWESALKSTVRLQWTKGHDPPETKTCCGTDRVGGWAARAAAAAAEAGELVTLYAIYLMLHSCHSRNTCIGVCF